MAQTKASRSDSDSQIPSWPKKMIGTTASVAAVAAPKAWASSKRGTSRASHLRS